MQEQFDRDNISQIVVNGLDFAVIKSIIEYMYCGETSVGELHVKYFIAAAKLFQLDALDGIFAENDQHLMAGRFISQAEFDLECYSVQDRLFL